MAVKIEGKLAESRRVEKVTLTGIAIILSFLVIYCLIYALSYPVGAMVRGSPLSAAFGNAWAMCNLILSLIGLVVILLRAKDYKRNDVLVSLAFSALVWLSMQSRYWLTGTTPTIPFFAPTFSGIETFLLTLGAIGLLKGNPMLHLRVAEKKYSTAAMSLFLGALLGLPFAALNVLFALGSGTQASQPYDIVFGTIVAIQPGLMEEVTFRFMFLGLALTVLAKFLPGKVAAISALLMAVVFHAALHVQDTIVSSPATALTSILVLSIVFGLPMALLAYKRDLESAVGFHWVIDAVRFSIFSL